MGPSLSDEKVTVSESEAAVARMVRNMLLNKVNFIPHFIFANTFKIHVFESSLGWCSIS